MGVGLVVLTLTCTACSPASHREPGDSARPGADGADAAAADPGPAVSPSGVVADTPETAAASLWESLASNAGIRIVRDSNRPGSPVTEIHASHATLPKDAYEALANLKWLQVLELSDAKVAETNARIGDAELASVAWLTELHELNLSRTGLGPETLRSFGKLSNLRKLDLSHCKLNGGFEVLAGFTAFRELKLSNTGFDSESAVHLSGLGQLEHLDLKDTPARGPALQHLAGLTQLKTLLTDITASDETVVHLRNLTRLEDMEVSLHDVTPAGMPALAGLVHLKKLVLQWETTDESLVHLSGLKSLQELRINSEKLTDAGMAHLEGLTRLRELALTQCPGLGDGALKLAGGLKQLTYLGLSDKGRFTGAGLAALKGLPSLRVLELGGEGIDDAGLKHFAALKSLRGLNLQAKNVTDAGLAALQAALPDLQVEFERPE